MSVPSRKLPAELFHLAWPVLIAQLAVMANGVIDTLMAGRLGAVDLAAVGIGASIYFTVFVTAMGILLALTPLVAHLHGAGERGAVGEEVRQSAWLSLALGAVVILILKNPEPFLTLSQLVPEVELRVRGYLDALCWSVPASLLFRVFYGFSSGIGRPRPVMVLNLIGVACKVPVNALFMYGGFGLPAHGAPGCAIATALIMWLLCLLAWGWCRGNGEYADYGLFARFSPPRLAALGELLRLGLPIGATFLVDVTAFTFMALFIARLGPQISAAHQVAANFAALIYMLPLSLGNAASVVTGHALGARGYRRARQAALFSLGAGIVMALAVSLCVWFGAAAIAALYTPVPAVREAAAALLRLVAVYHLADALQAVAVNVLRGYRKTTVPMVVFAVMLWGVGLAGGYVLGLTDFYGAARGAAGFWIAASGGLGLAALMVVAYLNRVAWQASLPGVSVLEAHRQEEPGDQAEAK